MYSFGIWQLGGLLANALRNIGVICLPTGNYLDFKEQQEYMERFDVTVLAGTASYIYNLAHEVDLPAELKEKMKAIMIGGEGLSQSRRQLIEEKLGGEVFMNYGMMEFGGGIGSECTCHNGYHIFPNVYHEIIDPKSNKPVEPGEYGELVLTSLAREAMPLIRYRTGDITREITEPCACGLKLPKIDYIKGRVDDRIILGSAEKYYPKDFDEIFEPLQAVKDYQIIVTRVNGKDLLKIHVLTDQASESFRQELLAKIYSITPLKVDIFQTKTIEVPEIVFTNKFSNTKEKKPRIIDKRENS
jgi:phenylacetate-CoA ligase